MNEDIFRHESFDQLRRKLGEAEVKARLLRALHEGVEGDLPPRPGASMEERIAEVAAGYAWLPADELELLFP